MTARGIGLGVEDVGSLLDRVGAAATVVDLMSRAILRGNRKFCDMSGFAPEELAGVDLSQLHEIKDLEWMFQVAGGSATDNDRPRRASCLGKAGRPFDADLLVTPLSRAAGGLILVEYGARNAPETAEHVMTDHRLRASHLAMLTRRLAASWDRDALGSLVIEAGTELMGAGQVVLVARRGGPAGTELLAAGGLGGEALAALKERIDDLLLGGLLAVDRPTLLTSGDAPALAASGIGSLVVYGLETEGKVPAAWALGFSDPEAAARTHLDLGQTFAAHLAGTLSGVLLLERTRKEKRHQEVLNHVISSLRSAGDLDGVLKALMEELARELGVDRCLILLSADSDDHPGAVRVEFEHAAPGLVALRECGPVPFAGTALGAAVLYSKGVLAVQDLRQRPDLTEDHEVLFQKIEVRGLLAGKIISRGEFVGLVAAATSSAARAWADDEIELVRAIADHVSITLQTSRLMQANEDRAHQLTLLAGVQQAAANLQQEDMLRADQDDAGLPANMAREAARAIAEACPGVMVRISGIEGARGDIIAAAGTPAGRVAQAGVGGEAASTLAIPIRKGKRELGVIHLRHGAVGDFNAADRRSFEILADRLAVALENAALFRQIERERREWERTFDAIPDMLSVHDGYGRLLRANLAFQVRLGGDPREYAGRSCTDLVETIVGRAAPCPHEEAERLRHPVMKEIQGDLGIFSLTAIPCFDQAGHCVYVIHVCREITQEKQIREQLLQSEKMAAVGSLVSGVAHELNNPLAGITGFAQLLLERDLEAGQRRSLERIRDEADRAARIVKNLLTFARKHKPETVPTDVMEVLDRTLELRAYDLRVNKIKLVSDLAKDLPKTMADPNQLQQIFLNIITNAEQAMREAHGQGVLKVSSSQADGRIRVLIEDDGPGIRPEHLKLIFDPFFTTKPVGKGTGLGLSICHGIIKEHGGTIAATSALGKGTVFTIELPIVKGEEARVEAKTTVSSPPVKATILVVDDEETIRELTRDVLLARGHAVDAVDSVARALEALKTKRYDLILSDLKMPEQSGQEFFETLRANRSEFAQRMVFVSGDTVSQETQAFLARSGRPYLLKPFKVNEMIEMVERLAAGN